MRIEDNVINAFRSLPKWVRDEISRDLNVGWKYSGNEIIGWSWCPNIINRLFLSSNHDVDLAEVIPSEPDSYLQYIRKLLFDFESDININVSESGKDVKITIEAVDRDDDEVNVTGIGSNSIEALINLVAESAEFYWYKACPSLSDIRKEKLCPNGGSEQQLFFGTGSDPSTYYDVDVIEDRDGNYAITFDHSAAAIEFASTFNRFQLEGIDKQIMLTDDSEEIYFGKYQMMESVCSIYSNYGKIYEAMDLSNSLKGALNSVSGTTFAGLSMGCATSTAHPSGGFLGGGPLVASVYPDKYGKFIWNKKRG